MKKIILIFATIAMILALASAAYAAEAYTATQDDEVRAVIEKLKSEYIRDDMTDFEKEMQIIQWMVANIDYDFNNYLNNTIPQESYSAYGALVKHAAVCDGYSDAFKRLGEACRLQIEKISGEGYGYNGWGRHAWNQILLDGEWYNVDVTWEDPVPSNKYGFGHLRNDYINCADINFPEHRTSDTNRHTCMANKYGHEAVAEYLKKEK